MYRILLPVDADESRVDAQVETVLELLSVAGTVQITLLSVLEDGSDADADPMETNAARDAADSLRRAGVSVVERREVGEPATTIVEVARDLGVDQIVLGGRKRSNIGSLVFGSVSQEVVRRARRPVTIAGSAADLERPSHRCRDCGEAYYTSPATAIGTCRRCGGIHVESLEDERTTPEP